MPRFLFLAVAVTLYAAPIHAAAKSPGAPFEKSEAMIPMRDGVRLRTKIYRPKRSREPLPFLLVRTPYGSAHRDLLPEPYIFVSQDIRGRYGSEGQFVMMRPPRDHADHKAIDESTDTYDTIEWLLKNVPNHNSRVGVMGISYPGWLTVMAMLDPHPALKAVSEQASPADMFLGDDFHHNGAFRLSYGFEYVAMMETSKENFHFRFDRHDTFEWYLRLGPLSAVDLQYFHGERPTWNAFVEHPDYDSYWQKQAVTPYLDKVTVPNLNVAGWWDQEDFYGPLKIYETLEKHDTAHRNYLVAGPWNHGGWSRPGRSLGGIDFGGDPSAYYREKVLVPWFAYWLKDRGSIPLTEALTFQTGTNEWVATDAWPPREAKMRNLYFQPGGRLGFETPTAEGDPADTYLSDPAHPVPYRHRPIEATYGGPSGWAAWQVEDQRFVDGRPDVLTFQTEPLAENFTISGQIRARLFAATTGADSDWIVKLIDRYPDDEKDRKLMGYQLMIVGDVVRARYRKSFEHPEPVPAGEPVEYTIDLHSNNHCFLKGHSIMVQVQSTWFPLIDRNPQTFVENIFRAKAEDFRIANQRIFRSRAHPSHIELPVLR
jgi:putative CocE/NonD family hydrolase